MICRLRSGFYRLIETRHHNKVLYLDNEIYAWVDVASIGEILVASHKEHKTDYVLGVGKYHLYDVEDEPFLSDQIHLELEVGGGYWQGYLLLSGLPSFSKKRVRIIPTTELVTGDPRLEHNKSFNISMAPTR